ncbi:oxalate:formate antiporter-like [Haliotis rubra]|uniref:oxalate:formate antiporter-like n=1 Tax=Haliotis rubra TaxID=36100 RepID=UPI001EE61279|nr:oxalate:formate antiporter-like [Haliotis rubra]
MSWKQRNKEFEEREDVMGAEKQRSSKNEKMSWEQRNKEFEEREDVMGSRETRSSKRREDVMGAEKQRIGLPKMVKNIRALPIRGVLTVIGGFLIHFTVGTGNIFGNINPYLTSYIRARSSSINHSLPLAALTHGVMHGAGICMAYPGAVKTALKWFPGKSGLVTGIILCGVGVGAIVFNQVVTAFINPDNLSPDETIKDDLFFTQTSLLDRVPYCFLLLGGVCTITQLFAVVFLMSTPTDTPTDTPTQEGNSEKEVNKSHAEDTNPDEKPKQVGSMTLDAYKPHSASISDNDDDHYTPRQVLQSKLFYLLWLINSCVMLGIILISTFYKTFSQTFIKDDHFLALAGSVGSAFNALGRPFWGAVGDKIGYRESLTIVIGVFGTAGATFTLCEYGGKAMLMIWLCLLNGTYSGFLALMPSLTVSLYGQKYYSVNYGLLTTSHVSLRHHLLT